MKKMLIAVLFLFGCATQGFIEPQPDYILKPKAIVELPAIPQFDVEKKIVRAVGAGADVWINSVDPSFAKRFYGLVEDPLPVSRMHIFRVKRECMTWFCSWPFESIQEELGGPNHVRTTIGKIYELLRLQGKGQRGYLYINDRENAFLVRDKDGKDCIVNVWANEYGWNFVAWPFEDSMDPKDKFKIVQYRYPSGLEIGDQIFSSSPRPPWKYN